MLIAVPRTIPPGFDEVNEQNPYDPIATPHLAFPGLSAEAATLLVER